MKKEKFDTTLEISAGSVPLSEIFTKVEENRLLVDSACFESVFSLAIFYPQEGIKITIMVGNDERGMWLR